MTLVAKWRMNWRSKRRQITAIRAGGFPHMVTSMRANGGSRGQRPGRAERGLTVVALEEVSTCNANICLHSCDLYI